MFYFKNDLFHSSIFCLFIALNYVFKDLIVPYSNMTRALQRYRYTFNRLDLHVNDVFNLNIFLNNDFTVTYLWIETKIPDNAHVRNIFIMTRCDLVSSNGLVFRQVSCFFF